MLQRSSLITALGLLAALAGASPAEAGEGDRWARTIERIASGVVKIRVDAPVPFDTEWENSTQATGFVVDAERGLILTNRHVVYPGPVVAEAVFQNSEEVPLQPVYRDPVHDFGLYRYDPEALRYIQPTEIELAPWRAQLGRDIRVVGNDAGERLSILAGAIARLDREAPNYGRGRYNDFNTFYIQAASGASGGSSGSPVIDIEGRAVALNAGARMDAQSSYFLPLDRVTRALDLIRAGQQVPRGTLQTTFVQRSYDELRRLGLTADIEDAARLQFPDQTGMLVVGRVVPEGPAIGALEPGDILIRVNGRMFTSFVPLAELIDDSVGETLSVEVQRGGERKVFELTVGDLHEITPDAFVQAGGSVFNRLSYQQARHFNLPPRGVYVADPGYMLGRAGIPRGSIIRAMNGERLEGLEDFRRVYESLADGARVPVRYTRLDEPQREILGTMTVDRTWFPARLCRMDPRNGRWPCESFAEAPENDTLVAGTVRFGSYNDVRAERLSRSLAWVEFDMPYRVEGMDGTGFSGTGLVVDKAQGLVLVDRATVPSRMGDVRLTFAGSLEVPGEVVFLHPLRNLALVRYDPGLLVGSEVRSATLNPRPPRIGGRLSARKRHGGR
jgi:pro-apoptotic serine protease NMA111